MLIDLPEVNRDKIFEQGYSKYLIQPDVDMWVDHSDVTATSSKLPYKAAFLPNKGIKKKLWSARFSLCFFSLLNLYSLMVRPSFMRDCGLIPHGDPTLNVIQQN